MRKRVTRSVRNAEEGYEEVWDEVQEALLAMEHEEFDEEMGMLLVACAALLLACAATSTSAKPASSLSSSILHSFSYSFCSRHPRNKPGEHWLRGGVPHVLICS